MFFKVTPVFSKVRVVGGSQICVASFGGQCETGLCGGFR